MKKSNKKKPIPVIKAPRGYSWKIRTDRYSVHVALISNSYDMEIGHVNLYDTGQRFYETHSELDDNYRGKGYGTLMYAKAIAWCLKRGYRIKSSGASSNMAQRVWKGKTLRKFFKIRVKHSYDPQYDKWYAYAK